MSKLTWLHKDKTWTAIIGSDKYGLFAWINKLNTNSFEVTSSKFFEKPLIICKSLTSAKRWVAINLKSSRDKDYQAIINAYDPYYQPEGAELDLTPEGMIYNLQNIRQDLNSDETALIEAIDRFIKTYGGLKL